MSKFIPFPGANPDDVQKVKKYLQKKSREEMENIIRASIVFLLDNECSPEEPLIDKLSWLLNDYNEKLGCIIDFANDLDHDLLQRVKELTCIILCSIRLYQQGKRDDAYNKFIEIFGINENLFDVFISEKKTDANVSYYRVRSENGIPIKTRADMFHIPFEKKQLACQCRYSEAQSPSLYLASSLYTAWKETVCGQFEGVYFSRYEIRKNIKIIDLIFYPELFLHEKDEKRKAALFLFMPLFIASSMKVPTNNPDSGDEYIIPQFLMQYVRKNKKNIVGIQYTSTHWINEKQLPALSEHLGACLVFPIRTDISSGYCKELANIFALTEPIKLPFSKITPLYKSDVTQEKSTSTPCVMYKDILHKYADFPFGKAEIMSKKEETKLLSTTLYVK